MQTLKPLIAAHPFFHDLPAHHLELIVGCASNVRFDAGQFIFREGEEAKEFYLIRHGSVTLEIFVPGRGTVPVQTLSEGNVFGWSWLFPPYRWHFDTRAATLTRALAFDGKCLRTKCEDDYELGYRLVSLFVGVLVERLQATRLQLLDVYGVH